MKRKNFVKISSVILSLMLVLTMIPSFGAGTVWAADDTSETQTPSTISFRICDRTQDIYADKNTLRTLKPGQSLTKDCEVEDTKANVEYMASFASDGKTLLLNNYDRGTITVYNTNELTIKLKGESTIQQLINSVYNTALDSKLLTGISLDSSGNRNNPLNLTITSADPSSKGKLILKNENVFPVSTNSKYSEIFGITAKSLTLDNVDLELNLKNDEKRTSCTALSTHEGMTVKNNSTVNINISDTSNATVYGLYNSGGALKIEQSTVNVNFKNCTTDGFEYLSGIAKTGGGTDANKRDILISNSNVSIKAENEEITDDYPERKYGIYCNHSNNKIKISGSSSVTINGGNNKFGYGILDSAKVKEEYANCAGVIVDGNNSLNISNVVYGISSYKRGVDMINANVNVDADDTAVYGYIFDANNRNLGEYGLHVTGNSHVDLKACTNAVRVNRDGVSMYSKGKIDLAEGGTIKMKITPAADNTLQYLESSVLTDRFELGSNTAITKGSLNVAAEDNDLYVAQGEEKSSDDGNKEYTIEFKYHDRDILKVNWNQSTNKVSWSDTSLLTKYELALEGAENNGSTEPEYKVLKRIVETIEGTTYTLPKDITDMMIPTMNYRIKVTPYTTNTDWKTIDSMASYSNTKNASEEVGTLEVMKDNYWQIGWTAHESASAYYYDIKKYDEKSHEYKTVYSSTKYVSDDRTHYVYDLRNDLDKEWCTEGKYILSITAANTFNKNNVLARGESTEPIVLKFNTLNGSSDESLNAKFTAKVTRQTSGQYFEWINGDDNTDNDFDPTKLLYGDIVTLTYKPAGVTVSGTAVSWNNTDDAVYLLYSKDTTDAVIKAEWKDDSYKTSANVLYTDTKETVTANSDTKRYNQTFSFDAVNEGEYKLVIFKPGKYVPKIITIQVESADFDAGEQKLWLYGDVNYDGKIKTGDATQIYKYLVGERVFNSDENAAADITSDGKVMTGDATQIYKYLVGESSLFDNYK